MIKLQNEVLAHYQNQFFKQIHVLILGLDVLGNPLGIIRGLAEGVGSLFYEPYKVRSIQSHSIDHLFLKLIRVQLKVQLSLLKV